MTTLTNIASLYSPVIPPPVPQGKNQRTGSGSTTNWSPDLFQKTTPTQAGNIPAAKVTYQPPASLTFGARTATEKMLEQVNSIAPQVAQIARKHRNPLIVAKGFDGRSYFLGLTTAAGSSSQPPTQQFQVLSRVPSGDYTRIQLKPGKEGKSPKVDKGEIKSVAVRNNHIQTVASHFLVNTDQGPRALVLKKGSETQRAGGGTEGKDYRDRSLLESTAVAALREAAEELLGLPGQPVAGLSTICQSLRTALPGVSKLNVLVRANSALTPLDSQKSSTESIIHSTNVIIQPEGEANLATLQRMLVQGADDKGRSVRAIAPNNLPSSHDDTIQQTSTLAQRYQHGLSSSGRGTLYQLDLATGVLSEVPASSSSAHRRR